MVESVNRSMGSEANKLLGKSPDEEVDAEAKGEFASVLGAVAYAMLTQVF